MMTRVVFPILPLVAALLFVGCQSEAEVESPLPAVEEAPEPAAESPLEPPPAHAGVVPAPAPSGAVCDFVPADQPIGGVACPEGCVMVLGAPIDEQNGCARTGDGAEVALGCLRLPADIRPGGMCYRSPEGHAVVSTITYPALAEAGWTACEDDYEFRSVAPCPPVEGKPSGEPTEATAQ